MIEESTVFDAYFSRDTWKPEDLGLVTPTVHFKDVRQLDKMIRGKNEAHEAATRMLVRKRWQKRARLAAGHVMFVFLALAAQSGGQVETDLQYEPAPTPLIQESQSTQGASPTEQIVFNQPPLVTTATPYSS